MSANYVSGRSHTGRRGIVRGSRNTVRDRLDENVAGALACVLGFISGIFFMTEKQNDFARFHAPQNTMFSVATFGVYWVINTVLFSPFFIV